MVGFATSLAPALETSAFDDECVDLFCDACFFGSGFEEDMRANR